MSHLFAYNNLTPRSESEITLQIEHLVKHVISHYQPIKLSRDGRRSHLKFDGAFYLEILEELPIYLSVYYPPRVGQPPSHDYSEHLEIFWQACIETGLIAIKFMRYPFQILTMSRAIALVDLVYRYANTTEFKRRIHDRLYETKRKRDNLREVARSIHQRYSRILVVRVDFGYLKECRHLVRIDDFFKHRDAFLRQKQTHKLLRDCIKSPYVMEQGAEKGGYHIHAAFYFHGNDHQNDFYIADQIGEIWVKVTRGLGSYYNVHRDKEKFKARGTLGIGMIHRSDQIAVHNSIESVSYFAKLEKEEQNLRIKPHGARVFATGMSRKNKRRKHNRTAH